MKIVAIVGSPRPEGNTSYLVDEALDEARKQGIATEKVILVERQIGWCLGHLDCGTQTACLHDRDDAAEIIEKLFSADGVILSSAVQMGNVTGIMKNFMDRTRFKRRQKIQMPARSIGLIAVASSSGIDDTLAVLERYVGRQSPIPPEKIHKVGGKANKPGEAKANPELTKQARDLGKKMAEEIKKPAG
ncbi:MAG: NADPH-dependent reductase [Dehalococcoidia bacterium]|nr:NADPH-dependent reductase [Dehalococcoidia bacterium]